MNKGEMFLKLQTKARNGDCRVEVEIFQGFLERNVNLQNVLASILAEANRMTEGLLAVDLENPSERARASKMQGVILGYRSVVENILNIAYDRRNEDAA